MEILILGGTGAMGVPLVKLLAKDNKLFVTTRSQIENKGNITYIQGNAKDREFFSTLMEQRYDSIIDFMVYGTEELKERLPLLLDYTQQFFSSAHLAATLIQVHQ